MSKSVEVAAWSTGSGPVKRLSCEFEVLPVVDGQFTDAALRVLSSKVAEILDRGQAERTENGSTVAAVNPLPAAEFTPLRCAPSACPAPLVGFTVL